VTLPLILLAALSAAAPPAPLSLADALAEASAANPDVAASTADLRAATVEVTRSYSAFAPRVDLLAVFGHDWFGASSGMQTAVDPLTGLPASFDATSPATDYGVFGLQLRLKQTLFDGLKTVREVGLARAQERAARAGRDESRVEMALKVVQRFHEVVRAERTLAVLEATVERSAKTVETADALFAAGRMPKAETLAARVNLGNDRIAVEGQRGRLSDARHALASAMGRTHLLDVEVQVPAGLDGQCACAEPPPIEALLQEAQRHRPALAQARAIADAAHASVGVARAGWYPTLSATAAYSRVSDQIGGVYGDPSKQWAGQVMLVLGYNLLASGETRATNQRAEALAERANAEALLADTAVAHQIADARTAVVVLAHTVALASANLAVAREGVDLQRERFAAGRASQLEVRDANQKLTQAELAVVQARIDYASARATLGLVVAGDPGR
jgi:outer membrane protein TolC